MRKKRKSRSKSFTLPLAFFTELFSAGMQIAELYTSSAKVIAHRTDMITRALQGELPLLHKEFSDMWQEKIIASGESLAAGIGHIASNGAIGSPLAGLMKTITPYSKRASATAKRLAKSKKA